MYYKTIKEIKDANKVAGKHWFDKATMDAFFTEVLSEVYGGRYFISSDKREEWLPRMYSICQCVEGKVGWVSGPLEYASADDAIKAVHELLENEAQDGE